MNLEEAIRSVLSQYAGFTGRARRSEYWFWTLAVVIVEVVVGIVDAILGTPILGILLLLGLIIPGLAVSVRRLHDISKSGWFLLISLIPLIGGIVLIIWFVGDSHPDNEYGPNPKAGVGTA